MWIYMDIEGYICSETNWIKFFMVTSTLWFLLSSKNMDLNATGLKISPENEMKKQISC